MNLIPSKLGIKIYVFKFIAKTVLSEIKLKTSCSFLARFDHSGMILFELEADKTRQKHFLKQNKFQENVSFFFQFASYLKSVLGAFIEIMEISKIEKLK